MNASAPLPSAGSYTPVLSPILEIGRSIIENFMEIKRTLELKGQKIDDMDLLIAATELTLNYRFVTSNTKHFKRIEGLQIENWME